MTLHAYFARKFLFRFGALFLSFLALAVLTDATALLGQFQGRNVGLGDTLRLALLKAPTGVYQLMSLIAALASLLVFLGLSRSSELVATRAAGQSAFRSLIAPVTVAFLIGVVGVMALNPLAATTLRKFETETGRYKSGTVSSFSLSRKGLWLRQGSARGQTVIFAERANFNGTRLSGVTFWEFDANNRGLRRIESQYAVLKPGVWKLGPGKFWRINDAAKVPDQTAKTFDSLSVPSDLTRRQIMDSFGDPTTVSIWDMPAFIKRLEKSGFSSASHRVRFQIELASPLLLAAMVMVGAAFSMRHARAGRTGLMVLLTVLSGLAVYIFQNFAQILGANGAIPVAAAAWGPPVAAIMFASALILHMEDG